MGLPPGRGPVGLIGPLTSSVCPCLDHLSLPKNVLDKCYLKPIFQSFSLIFQSEIQRTGCTPTVHRWGSTQGVSHLIWVKATLQVRLAWVPTKWSLDLDLEGHPPFPGGKSLFHRDREIGQRLSFRSRTETGFCMNHPGSLPPFQVDSTFSRLRPAAC